MFEANPHPAAIVATPRLYVRPFTLDDAQAVNERLDSDPRQMQFTGSVKTLDETREALRRQIAWTENHARGCGKWAVVSKHDDTIVGWVALVPLPGRPDDIEVGYIVSPLFWGQGYATEAARGVVNYGFDWLGLPAVYSMVHPENTSSVRVTQKLGMEQIGQITCSSGQLCDLYRRDRRIDDVAGEAAENRVAIL